MPTLKVCPICDGETVFCRVEWVDGQTHLGRYCLACKKRMPGLVAKASFEGDMADLIGVPSGKENRLPARAKPKNLDPETPEPVIEFHRASRHGEGKSKSNKPKPQSVHRQRAAAVAERYPNPFKTDESVALCRLPYKEYLLTAHWQKVRGEALKRARYRCMLCNGGAFLQVHHRTYERRGAERPEDLTVLCRDCHGRFHDKLPEEPD